MGGVPTEAVMGQSRGSISQIGSERAKTSTKNLGVTSYETRSHSSDHPDHASPDARYLRSARRPTLRKDLSSACLEFFSSSCGRYRLRCATESRMYWGASMPFRMSLTRRSPSLALVGDDLGVEEAHPPSPRLRLAPSRRQDVLHPVALGSVGEGDDVAAVGTKCVDGSAVGAA